MSSGALGEDPAGSLAPGLPVHVQHPGLSISIESIPRQVDKKSRVPEEEKEVWGSQGGDRSLEFSRRKKGQTFLSFSTFLRII